MVSETSDRTIGGRGAAGLTAVTVLSAGVGYAALVLSARTLSSADNANFITFWSLLYGIFGVLAAVQVEGARAVFGEPMADSRRPRVLVAALVFGLALAGTVAATAVIWSGRLFTSSVWGMVAVVVLTVAGFSGHQGLTAILTGTREWRSLVLVIGTESLVRLGLVIVVAMLHGSLLVFAIASGASSIAWLVLVALHPRVREATRRRADVDARAIARNLLHAAAATAASAVLTVGFPVLIRLTTPDRVYLAAAPLLMAISLTRAPLMVPMTAFQGVAITHVMRRKDGAVGFLTRFCAGLLVVGLAGAALATLVGPSLMAVLLGPRYIVPGWVLGGLTLCAAALAMVTLTGASCVALGRHRAFAVGWAVATALSIGLLLWPAPLELRVLLSLGLGPVLGLVVHGLAIAHGARAGAVDSAPDAARSVGEAA